MDKLDRKEQAIGTVLFIAVSIEIIAPAYYLFKLLGNSGNGLDSGTFTISLLFMVVCISGFLGGSTRALSRLITQLNDNPEEVKARLSRWFMYLVNPFVGVGGGLALFIVTNMGLLTGMPLNKVEFSPLSVILISFIGGMFFEDVFKRLHELITGNEKAR